jgi:hypothetical protein
MHNTLELPGSLFGVITFWTGGINTGAFIVLSVLSVLSSPLCFGGRQKSMEKSS